MQGKLKLIEKNEKFAEAVEQVDLLFHPYSIFSLTKVTCKNYPFCVLGSHVTSTFPNAMLVKVVFTPQDPDVLGLVIKL